METSNVQQEAAGGQVEDLEPRVYLQKELVAVQSPINIQYLLCEVLFVLLKKRPISSCSQLAWRLTGVFQAAVAAKTEKNHCYRKANNTVSR